jgi:hypothetical protein
MNKKKAERCVSRVAHLLVDREQVQMVEGAQIGEVSVKKQLATAAVVGIATGGMMTAVVRPQAFWLILTDLRLFLVQNNNGSVGKRILGEFPREAVQAGPLRTHILTRSMEVTIAGTPYKFSWGRLQGKMPDRVAEALSRPGWNQATPADTARAGQRPAPPMPGQRPAPGVAGQWPAPPVPGQWPQPPVTGRR